MDIGIRRSVKRTVVLAALVGGLAVGCGTSGGEVEARAPRAKPAVTKVASSAPKAVKSYTVSQLMAIATTAQGIHMRYGGITTGPLNASHTNDIQLDSFQFGIARPIGAIVGGTRTAGKPAVSEITVTHQTDKFSTPLIKASLNGAPAAANLYFTNLSGTGGTPLDYLQIDLTGTLVSGFSMSSGSDNPSESISLNFTVITFKYKASTTAIVQTVSYNLATAVTT